MQFWLRLSIKQSEYFQTYLVPSPMYGTRSSDYSTRDPVWFDSYITILVHVYVVLQELCQLPTTKPFLVIFPIKFVTTEHRIYENLKLNVMNISLFLEILPF